MACLSHFSRIFCNTAQTRPLTLGNNISEAKAILVL
jgi:hypothetical protein